MHNALISGHPGRLILGTYGGIARLLSPISGPGRGHWTAFALPSQDTRGKTRGICNIAAILKMKDPDRGDWVLPLNGFQNGDGEKGKRLLRCVQKTSGLAIFAYCIYYC